jgi:hypothetical protein
MAVVAVSVGLVGIAWAQTSRDGARVRLPGFVVMLEGTPKGVTEFLLVPYFGACIYVARE